MNTVRQFNSAKVQLTMVGDRHPKGVNRLFNNAAEHFTDEQAVTFSTAIEALTSEKCTGINIITSAQLSLA